MPIVETAEPKAEFPPWLAGQKPARPDAAAATAQVAHSTAPRG
jgi:hypothetical protein